MQGQTTWEDNHSHTYTADENGNGKTSTDNGHFHKIENWIVLESDDHIHTLKDAGKSLTIEKISQPLSSREQASEKTDDVLLDDHRWMHAFWASLKRGEDFQDWTLEDVEQSHAWIVAEMLTRFLFPSMQSELDQTGKTLEEIRYWLDRQILIQTSNAEPTEIWRAMDFIQNLARFTDVPRGELRAALEFLQMELSNQGIAEEPAELAERLDREKTAPDDDSHDYAPVRSSGVELGHEITLPNVVNDFKSDFVIDPHFISLSGDILSGETDGMIDFHVNGNFGYDLRVPIEFRLGRSVSNPNRIRVNYHSKMPVMDMKPVYALVAERINPNNDIIRMSLDAGEAGNEMSDMSAEIGKSESMSASASWEPVSLEKFSSELKPMLLRSPFIFIVGGLANRGSTKGDVDILLRGIFDEDFRNKISSYFLKNSQYADRIQILQDYFHGPFTSHVPIYNLALVPVEESEPIGKAHHTPEAQAEASKEEDKVEMMRFFTHMKPTKGYREDQRQTIENFLALFSEESFPVAVTKKYDGAAHIIWKDGDEVLIQSTNGEDNTSRLPKTVEAVKKLSPEKLCMMAEVEMWDGDMHLPREAVAGYLHTTDSEPDDSDVISNIFDVLYFQDSNSALDSGDIHKKGFEERNAYLDEIGLPQTTDEAPDLSMKLNRTPSHWVDNIEDLETLIRELSSKVGSEGVVAKPADSNYVLDGGANGQIKYHLSALMTAIVTEKELVEGQNDVWTYDWGVKYDSDEREVPVQSVTTLNDVEYYKGGRTFNTSIDVPVGGFITIEFEQANHIVYQDKNIEELTVWKPRVISESDKAVDDISSVLESAKRNGILVSKIITEGGGVNYRTSKSCYSVLSPDPIGVAEFLKGAPQEDAPKYITNYIGSKAKLLSWIWRNTPEEVNTVVDAFAGSCSVAYMYKTKGKKVITCDRLNYSHEISKAIIRNNKTTLSESDLQTLTKQKNSDAGDFVRRTFAGIYFGNEVLSLIDILRANIESLSGAKKSLALFALGRTCQTAGGGFGHFGTSRIRTKSKTVFLKKYDNMLRAVNGLVIDNGEENISLMGNISQKMKDVRSDLVYFDPPYATEFSTTHYEKAYHFIEGLMTYWKDKEIDSESKLRSYKVDYPAVSKENASDFFSDFMGSSKHIKYWLLSYRDKSFPTSREIRKIVESNNKEILTRRTISHSYSMAGTNRQGDASNAKEYLYVCASKGANDEPKKSSFQAPTAIFKGQLFGSPGGKTNIASKIIKLFPDHETYVEPFIGGGGILFKKPPSDLEVINDYDSEIAFAYRFTQSYTEKDLEFLRKFDWKLRKKRWWEINRGEVKPSCDAERFAIFIYHIRGSFSCNRMTFAPSREGKNVIPIDQYIKRLGAARERLDGVKVLNQDYVKVIEKYDSKNSFIYLDPPYPGEWPRESVEGKFDLERLHSTVKKVKGKFLLSIDVNKTVKDMFSEFNFSRVLRVTMYSRASQTDRKRDREFEYLISNYEIRPKKKKTLFLPSHLELSKQNQDPYLIIPDEEETYRYVVQHHWRGRSVHADLRMESQDKDFLIGWTMSDQIEGKIEEPVTTLEQAREVDSNDDNFKINWSDGSWDQRQRNGALVNTNILCQKKAMEPYDWIDYEGVVEGGIEDEEPAPGATENYPGVFHILDEGTVEYGAQKATTHEYFFKGETFNYRIIMRLLQLENSAEPWKEKNYSKLWNNLSKQQILAPSEPQEEAVEGPEWLAIKPIDQTPYVLGGALDSDWMPPLGISALPKDIRDEIPSEYKYWQSDDKEEARSIRNDLVKAWNAGEVEIPSLSKQAPSRPETARHVRGEFALSYQWWRGPIVIREGPSTEAWHIFMDFDGEKVEHIKLTSDPLTGQPVAGTVEEDVPKDVEPLDLDGFLKPGTRFNPTKETPSWIKILDEGKVIKMVGKPTFKKYEFSGEKLSGLFIFSTTSEGDGSGIWTFEPSELPKPE